MALQYEINSEAFEELSDGKKELYKVLPDGETYRLTVEGIEAADELRDVVRKERESRAEARKELEELRAAQSKEERKRMEEQQQFEELYKTEQTQKSELQKQLDEMRKSVAEKERSETALGVVGKLTRDTKRAALLKKEAMNLISHTPEGIKINGPDGDAWDAHKLSEHLKSEYPFLVDGTQASGGGAAGSNKGGGATKKFNEYSGAELSALRKDDPEAYKRIRDEYHSAN